MTHIVRDLDRPADNRVGNRNAVGTRRRRIGNDAVVAGEVDRRIGVAAGCVGRLENPAVNRGIGEPGIVAEPEDLLDIVKAVKSPWVGINLDTGNFHTDDPYKDLASCAPYAVNVQVKAEIQKRGQKKEWADLKREIQILRDANYQGYVALEYESAEDPWTAVPRLLKELKGLIEA